MKRLLITGFEPFDNEKINPSLIAVESLGDQIGDYAALSVAYEKGLKL